ncbi:fam-a protein [Plasmodium yoelii]|nr:fam-a protein [Plasmodium yoelii]
MLIYILMFCLLSLKMNEFYIQIVLLLLSIFLCVNNKTLAIEFAPNIYIKPKPKKYYPNSEVIYERNKHLLHTDPREFKKASRFMLEALTQLKYHATSKEDYILYGRNSVYYMFFYKKKHRGYTNVKKIEYIIGNPNKYNDIVNMLWNPNCNNFFYLGSVKRKIVRVYSPNLVMIQQRSKKWPWSYRKYFYAIAAKFEISENKTIIVMASGNINDHNRKNKKYFENTIVESANLFEAEIDSEDDIKNGKLKKMFVNLNGYIIEKKKDHVYIIYVKSIRG